MAPRPSPQTERVVNLFEQLAGPGTDGMTLAEVSRHLGARKASCHSMLAALLIMLAACWLYSVAVVLMRLRCIILEREQNAARFAEVRV